MIDTIQAGDVITNTQTVLVNTGNRTANGARLEAEAYSLKTGAFKGVRWYSTEMLFSNLDKNWKLFRPA